MSGIIPIALRACALRLNLNRTLAGARTYSSQIGPSDLLEVAKPFMVITTESMKAEVNGRAVLAGARTTDLVLEMAYAKHVIVPDPANPGGDGILITEVPATDEIMECTLDMICRQATRNLFESYRDEAVKEWQDLFSSIVNSVEVVQSVRESENGDKSRYAARQMLFRLNTINEPAFGKAQPDAVWLKFIDLIERDPEMSLLPMAGWISAAIKGNEIPEWDQGRSIDGLTPAEAHTIGLSGACLPDHEPPRITEVEAYKTDEE